jgi:hypothetical protein
MKVSFLQLLFFVVACATGSCTTLLQQKNNLLIKIASLDLKKKVTDVKEISLGPIISKSVGFSNFAGQNFTENFRFNLIRKGYSVSPYVKKKAVGEKDEITANISNTSSPTVTQGNVPTSLSPQAYFPASTPVKLTKQEFTITDPSEIAEICKLQKTQVFIGGFIYEGRTGPLLNEEVTAGIILSIYDSEGFLLTQIQYIGDLSMEEFQNNSEVARLMSEKVKNLLK